MEVVGVRAVIDGVQAYVSGAQRVNTETTKMASTQDDAAKRTEASSGRMSKALGGVASIASGFIIGQGILAAPGILVAAANAAAEDAASTAKLQRAVENTGHAFDEYSGRIKDSIELAQKRGFTDDQARDSLAILTAQTDDAGEALKRFSIAQDLSRGSGLDVVTASRLLGKVTDENVNVLKRYGISVEKGAGETELLAAVQRKFSGQAETFANSAAGQAQAVKIAFHELSESIGYIILPIMGALAKVLNSAVIPALNKFVQFIGPKIQAEGKKLAAVLQASGIVKFAKDAGAALGPLGQYLAAVSKDGDLLNDWLTHLPPEARPVAIVLGTVVQIAKEVGRELATLARIGEDVLQFMGRLVAKVRDFLPEGGKLDTTLAKIGDNAAGIKVIATAITGFIAVMATAEVLNFASSIGTLATNLITFPVRMLQGAMDTITGFGRAAKTAADDAAAASSKVAGVAGTSAAQARECTDKTATCTEQVKVTGDTPITSEPITKEITEHVTVKEDPANQGKALGQRLGLGIAQGIGVGIGGAIGAAILVAFSPSAAATVAGAVAGLIVAPLTAAIATALMLAPVLILAGVVALVLKFRKALVAALSQVPRALAFVGGAIATAILFQLIGLPVLILHELIEGIKAGAPMLVSAGAEMGKGILRGLVFLHDDLPGLIGGAILAAVKLSMRYVEFMDQEVPRIIGRAFKTAVAAVPGILKAIPGFIRDLVGDIVNEARALPGQIGGVFEELPGITKRSAGGVLDVTKEIFGNVLDFITGLPFADVVGNIMGQVVEGFRHGFQLVDDITGNTLSRTLDSVRTFGGQVVDAFVTIAGGIAQAFAGIASVVTSAFGGVRHAIESAISFVANEVADFLQGVKDGLDAIPGPNPAGNALKAAIEALRGAAASNTGPAGGQANPGSQVPTGFLHLAGGTAGLPFPAMAVLGEHGRETAFLPAGTAVAPAQTTARLMSLLAGLQPGRAAPASQTIGITVPVSVVVDAMDWSAIRRAIHREFDNAFTAARSRNTRAGAPIGSGIG